MVFPTPVPIPVIKIRSFIEAKITRKRIVAEGIAFGDCLYND